MGTRGFIGFVIDGEEKITYNHFDSYPEGLGMEMLTWLRAILEAEKQSPKVVDWQAYVRNLKMVDSNSTPTQAQISELTPWSDTSVSEQSLDDWYCLLRKTQGDPGAILAAGYAIDSSDFPSDSLMCEWGYIIDVDTETFEVYEGFQKEPHHCGRFAHRPPVDMERQIGLFGHAYYPVALRAAWSFNAIPTGEDFLGILTDLQDEEV
jgi:hypothetical protein